MVLKSLSGRFLILTIIFVMLAEVLIFVPSVSRFRADYLQERLERSRIAVLSVLATPDGMLMEHLEKELLDSANVLHIVLHRDEMQELILDSPMPGMADAYFDLRGVSPWRLIMDACGTLATDRDRVIRVLGEPVKGAGLLIEVSLEEAPLRMAMIDYGWRILQLSLVISVITACLLFVTVRRFMVRPIEHLVRQIKSYEEAPEDVRRIIRPRASVTEIREAEVALNSMETRLSQSLRQKERLAALGAAVSKISHDLRNILTTTQLLVDRMEYSEDPQVRRSAPKLVNSISRAVNLCESTLAFGKAEERHPNITNVSLNVLFNDVAEAERLVIGEAPVKIRVADVGGMQVDADRDHLFRVISNLVRNGRQVLMETTDGGTISLGAVEVAGGWHITVHDTGPGLPEKAIDNIFKPFSGSARKGGTGLGLAISAELIAAHGGRLELVENSADGAAFRIWLPCVTEMN
ncbi:MAG: HAMP domain-containing histidine kinase [Rhodobacteraceae bacterium]|nr:HAMP domain-containing histidine kinase [Paracoccaceae bacterium]